MGGSIGCRPSFIGGVMENVNNVDLNDVSRSEYYNQPINIKAIVCGKMNSPYYVPKKVYIKCRDQNDQACRFNKGLEVELEAGDETILQFVDVPSSRMQILIRSAFKVGCKRFSYVIKEQQNIEHIYISQPVGEVKSKWGEARPAFYIGYGVDINTLYKFKGYPTSDPKNQQSTFVFTDKDKVNSDIENFRVSKDVDASLRKFQVEEKSWKTIVRHLGKLYDNYAHNITKIYDRFLLHLSVDLVFHSVLDFNFDGEYVHKGWMDAMVIGDTSCGKGYVSENLCRYYGVGEVIGADNASFAGLVAGLQQYGKNWIITWGKLPMNDGGLLIVDEAGEIKEDMWAKLSRIRSEGVAEINKIRAQMTNARTRTLWLANPPSKTVANYSYGIQSLMDLIKTPEDIRRFDYCCVVAHNEVSIEDINQSRTPMKAMFTRKQERDLILWIWSRKTEQIIFTKEAVKRAYELAIKLAESYDFSIPLIQGENVRIKLARIAAAFAGRVYSASKDGSLLIVEEVHIECAARFLDYIYKTDANGYFDYSKVQKERDEVMVKDSFTKIENYFATWHVSREMVFKYLLVNNYISPKDAMEYLNIPHDSATELTSILLHNHCLVRKGQAYVKTPALTSWLKKRLIPK